MKSEPILPHFRFLARRSRAQALTLVEVMVSMAVVGLVAGSALMGLFQTERRAFETRLETCAQTIAQSQIDRALNDKFVPQSDAVAKIFRPGGSLPAINATTTQYWDHSAEESSSSTPDTDAWYSDTLIQVPIYDPDPMIDNEIGETDGTVKLDITRLAPQVDGVSQYVMKVVVTVSYTWQNRSRDIVLSTLRVSDL